MKDFLKLGILAMVLVVSSLFADGGTENQSSPLLMKLVYYGAFITPIRNMQCEVYENKVVVKRLLGTIKTTEEKKIEIVKQEVTLLQRIVELLKAYFNNIMFK